MNNQSNITFVTWQQSSLSHFTLLLFVLMSLAQMSLNHFLDQRNKSKTSTLKIYI